MKITDIKPYPVWVGFRNQFIVKVETDEGIYGLGEGGLSGRELAVKGAVQHYREFLIGKDPLKRGALWQEMYRSQYFEGGRVLTAAISAIDIALHDIAGKALGVPVYQLLGGKQRDLIPCFATMGGASYEEWRDNAQLLIGQGWNVIRTWIAQPHYDDRLLYEPRESIGMTADWLTRLRAEVGPDPVLGIDYHHRLSVHARLYRGADPRRVPRGLRGAAQDDRCAHGHRRRVLQQVAVLALCGARHHQFRAHRHLQRGRVHRGDEGGGVVRGALYRPHAP
jgi:galactonate dehydratase